MDFHLLLQVWVLLLGLKLYVQNEDKLEITVSDIIMNLSGMLVWSNIAHASRTQRWKQGQLPHLFCSDFVQKQSQDQGKKNQKKINAGIL